MSITDTTATTTGSTSAGATTAPAIGGLAAIVGTGDHKTLGRLYVGCSLAFGALALAVLAWGQFEATTDAATDRAFLNLTLGHLGVVFLFVLPLFVGLATAVVPLQVGARTIAFPRAAAAAFWVWLLSAVLLLVSYLGAVEGGIGGSDANGVGLTQIALAGAVVSLLLATVCILTTIVALRTPGMALDRVPLFSWSMLVAGGVWMLTLPVFVANLALMFVDQKYGAPSGFAVRDTQWAQLSWITAQPQVFAFAIPALGIIGDVAVTMSGARMKNRGIFLAAVGVFGALAFGAYVQPAFNPDAYHRFPFALQEALLILPLLAVIGGIATVTRAGKARVASPMALSIVGLLLLVLGALACIPFGLGRLELGTTAKGVAAAVPSVAFATTGAPVYTWGVAFLVLTGAAAVGIGGIFFWSGKLAGRALAEPLGLLLALGALLGGVVLAAPFLVLGFANKSDGLVDSTKSMFVISAVGAVIVAAVALVATLLLVGTRLSVLAAGSTSEADPWTTGQSLEWATDSPPALGNFGEIAPVTSPEPLLDLADGGDR